ncbi:MAG: serine/threonine protein kinase [Polyangiaceae bacterium]|nr:serine/threonine protein kinase [Polyangiaceae bacterium]
MGQGHSEAEGASSPRGPARIGDYDVVRTLGEGGMGVVYEAEERLTGRRVALKVLNAAFADREEGRRRFITEMKILAAIEHPNIVRCLSAFETEGQLVMTLELLSGRTLREELEARGRLPLARSLHVAAAITSALVAAHERSSPVIHRDLKPENVMLLRDDTVKVMDFGIAKVQGDDQRRTQATQLVGTVRYMSPEQIDGRPVTAASDLYALGIVVYEMLAGRPPFDGSSLRELLRKQCEAPPPPLPDEVLDEVPAAVSGLLSRLLAKDSSARPSSAREVLAVLAPLLDATGPGRTEPGPTGAAPAAPTPTSGAAQGGKSGLDTIALVDRFEGKKSPTRRWAFAGAGALALAAAVIGAGVYSRGASTPASKSAKASAAAPSSTSAQGAPSSSAQIEGGDKFVGWKVPPTWREERSGSLTDVALFVVPRAAGDAEDATVTVRAPAKDPAATLANMERSFDLCAGCKTSTAMTVDTATVTVLDLKGASWFPHVSGQTGKSPKPKFEMVVAVVPVDKTHYIFRMLGPEATVSAARPDYDAFLASVRRK